MVSDQYFFLSIAGSRDSTVIRCLVPESVTMAENVPPATSTSGGGASATVTTGPGGGAEQNATNRGLPYYEKLRRDLRDTLQKKRLMDKSMVSSATVMAAVALRDTLNLGRGRKRSSGIYFIYYSTAMQSTGLTGLPLTGSIRRPNLPLRAILS